VNGLNRPFFFLNQLTAKAAKNAKGNTKSNRNLDMKPQITRIPQMVLSAKEDA
jgi:hypothetical protein